MKYLRGGLGAVLLFAVVVRVSAEVISPVLPTLLVLFCVVLVIAVIINRSFRI